MRITGTDREIIEEELRILGFMRSHIENDGTQNWYDNTINNFRVKFNPKEAYLSIYRDNINFYEKDNLSPADLLNDLLFNIMQFKKKGKLQIELNDYWTTCGDGCCDNYGTITKVNGIQLELHNDDTRTILMQVLEHLGYNVEIDKLQNGIDPEDL